MKKVDANPCSFYIMPLLISKYFATSALLTIFYNVSKDISLTQNHLEPSLSSILSGSLSFDPQGIDMLR